jgi:esterase/lipase
MNNLLSIFNAGMEYVDDTDIEFPAFNYERIYIKSLEQLRLLMENCKLILPSITAPTLILQSDKDPVVKPESANKILEKICSGDKALETFDCSRHVITLGEGNREVLETVYSFIDRHSNENKNVKLDRGG